MSARVRQRSSPAHSPDFLASVSDLMSGLIFVFIITVAVFALRLAKATTDLTNAEAVRMQVVETLADELRKEGIDVMVDRQQGVLRLTDRAIRFPRGVSEPEADHHANVGVVASVLLRVLRCYVAAVTPIDELRPRATRPPYCAPGDAGAAPYRCGADTAGAKVSTVLIEGHTDSVPIGAGFQFKDNLELSAARAAAVFRMMQQCEPQLSGLINLSASPVLSVSGYGDTRPVDRDHREADANRRIDLRFLMEPPQVVPQPIEDTKRELAE